MSQIFQRSLLFPLVSLPLIGSIFGFGYEQAKVGAFILMGSVSAGIFLKMNGWVLENFHEEEVALLFERAMRIYRLPKLLSG